MVRTFLQHCKAVTARNRPEEEEVQRSGSDGEMERNGEQQEKQSGRRGPGVAKGRSESVRLDVPVLLSCWMRKSLASFTSPLRN